LETDFASFLAKTPQQSGTVLARRLQTAERNAMQKINPFLWYDTQALEAAEFYVRIFKNSKIGKIIGSDPPCISAAPAALDRYLAASPAMSLIPVAPFADPGVASE